MQEHKKSANCVDFDKFLLSRIREFKVIFQHLDNPATTRLEVMLDPEKTVSDIIHRLGRVGTSRIKITKC